jgi:hypothetical protein
MTRSRPWLLVVDQTGPNVPQNRYFGSLEKALEAWEKYPDHLKRFSGIMNLDNRGIYMHDGKRTM